MDYLDYTGLGRFWNKVKVFLANKITGDGVNIIKRLTQEEYDALPESEKNDGTVYITDREIEGKVDAITIEQIDSIFDSLN